MINVIQKLYLILHMSFITGYLYYLTKAILDSVEFPKSREKRKSLQLLNTLTKPLSNLFVQVCFISQEIIIPLL